MEMKQNKMLLAVAVLAITMSVFAILPMDDTDAADPLDLTSITLENHPERGPFLKATFNQDLEGKVDFTIPELSYMTQIDMDKRSNKAVANLFLGDKTITEGVQYTLNLTATGGMSFTDTFMFGDAPVVPGTEYTVDIEIEGYGTVECAPPSGATGTEIVLSYTPDDGYVFKEWQVVSGGVTIVDNKFTIGIENVIIKAIFEAEGTGPTPPTPGEPDTYTITWIDGDGEVIGTETVSAGTTPSYNIDTIPTKAEDADYTYTFNETWSPVPYAADKDQEYVAQFDKQEKEPTGGDEPVTPGEPDDDIVWETVTLTGVLDSFFDGKSNQIIVVSDDLTIKANGSITVLGQFIVEEGAEVIFEAGSSIVFEARSTADIAGDIIIEAADETVVALADEPYTFTFGGKEMEISGSMVLEGKDAFAITNADADVTISGYFEIAEEASADLANATLAEGGLIAIYGVATTNGGQILVNGEIDIVSEGSEIGFTVMDVQLGLTGIIDITNLYGEITITDSALVFEDKTQPTKKKDAAYDNTIVLTNVNGVIISETMEIETKTDKVTGDKYKVGNNAMLIAGSISVASDYIASNDIAGLVAVAGGNVRIIEDASVGVPMTVDGLLTVEAVVDATAKGVTITNAGLIDILGKVTTNTPIAGAGVVNAAMYETDDKPPYYVYTTIEDALASGATKITVTGEITISEDLVIPVGTTVDASKAEKVTIKDPATVTVQADAESRKSGRFNTPAGVDSVDVKGTLVVEDAKKSGVKAEAILSDTTKAVEDAVSYTNVYNALKNANEGETVEITRGQQLLLKEDLTVPTGVTLKVPAGEEVLVDNDVTVTVDGVLDVIGAYDMKPEIKDKKEAGATVVNGKMIIANGNEVVYQESIVGAYYEIDDELVVTPLATAAQVANDIESEAIALFGKQTVDVSFAGYAPEKATDELYLLINDGVEGTITLGKVILIAEVYDAPLDLTVVLSQGSVILDNVIGVFVAADVETLVGEEDVTVSVAGMVVAGFDDEKTTKVIEGGSVSFTGAVSAYLVTAPEIEGTAIDPINYGEVVTTIPADATVTLFAAEAAGPVNVDGALLFSDVGYDIGDEDLVAGPIEFMDLTVMGTTASIPVDEDEEPITATVYGGLYVGIVAEDLGIEDLAASASASDIELGADAYAYVAPGSTVGDAILDDLVGTEYYDDKDVLYVTAYGDVAINAIEMDPENAIWMCWTYVNAKDEVKMVEDGILAGTDGYEKVTAKINYEIYAIKVIADNGIGAVAIDGLQLERANNTFFTAANNLLKAGTHSLSYKLDAGYDDVNVVIKVDGVAVSGLDFTLQGTPEIGEVMTVYINIEGTEKVDLTPVGSGGSAGGEDGMSLTEILLIVLVVLILIMAIIVALRLMRS